VSPAVLDGLTVLDLSTGIAGPITGMLLADHGAHVIKVEPPAGDRFGSLSGARVWNRGKQREPLDLKTSADRERLLMLADDADVLLESYRPGTTERLGVDFPTVCERNPRLVYCSITPYGRGTRDADRPGYDALVAARTGLHWEQRGWAGTNVDRLAGRTPRLADIVPTGMPDGAARDGPLFSASTWPSLGAAFCATTAISAALLARETTGRGQWVETSLLQGSFAASAMTWQRYEKTDAPGLWSWMFDARAPKGFFRCANDRWVQIWVQRPGFVLGAADGDTLGLPEGFTASRHDPERLGTGEGDLAVLIYYTPLMADAFARFPAQQWVDVARDGNVALQMVRTPEEALDDPSFLADGCVVELDGVRQVGEVYRLSACPSAVGTGFSARSATHGDVQRADKPGTRAPRTLAAPLDGVRVLDLGFAIAGPFGAQLLGDLGADVIKVNSFTDAWWHANHLAYCCNRGKRSIAVDLKD
jgi:crotonobetainyl-CoA:carnitine CoA-transferase CaiB-like acyl-CoA transferase